MTYDNWKAHNTDDDGWEDWPPEEEAEMGTINITKPVRTKKDWREVKKLSYLGEFIVGLVDNLPHFWVLNGDSFEINMDIENVPEPRYVWLAVYRNRIAQYNKLIHALEAHPNYILRVNLDTGEAVKEEV